MPELSAFRKMSETEILRVAARNPTLREAAVELRISHQTLKNWLSAYYAEHEYSGLHQALYWELIEPRDEDALEMKLYD